jgi:hypothetical protein
MKKEILVIIVLIFIYIISVFGCYSFFGIAFSKEGRWSNLHPGVGEIIITFLPVVNTFFAVVAWNDSPYKVKVKNSDIDTSTFFNIKDK